MTEDHHDIAPLVEEIAGEQDLIGQLAERARPLTAVQQAKRRLAARRRRDLWRGVAQRHPAVEVGA